MNSDKYLNIKNTPDYNAFTFTSIGRHGELIKVVSFDEMLSIDGTFNLSLGTIGSDGIPDFETITNNGDRNKILATVAQIIIIFFEKYPGAKVYIIGSDNRRTMLYQRAINYGYEELKQNFIIYGDASTKDEASTFEIFDRAKTYSGFLIQRR